MVQPAVPVCLNIPANILLEGAQELLGQDIVQKVMEIQPSTGGSMRVSTSQSLSSAGFKPGTFFHSLEEMYGKQGGHGLALRIGRSAFRGILKQYGDAAGLYAMHFRLLPAPVRLENGLHILARIFAEQYGDQIQITDQSDAWEWTSMVCPICATNGSTHSCRFLMIGLLQEFMTWAGGGRYFQVTEKARESTSSPSTNHQACVFRIEKKPLD